MQTSVPSGPYAASNTALFPGCTIPVGAPRNPLPAMDRPELPL